jgi:hypothetical protein
LSKFADDLFIKKKEKKQLGGKKKVATLAKETSKTTQGV